MRIRQLSSYQCLPAAKKLQIKQQALMILLSSHGAVVKFGYMGEAAAHFYKCDIFSERIFRFIVF